MIFFVFKCVMMMDDVEYVRLFLMYNLDSVLLLFFCIVKCDFFLKFVKDMVN